MLSKVRFQAIKSLLDVTVDLSRFTVLVGPNGCGKSTLLRQIELLCGMTQPHGPNSHVLGSVGWVLNTMGQPEFLRTRSQVVPMAWEGTSSAGSRMTVAISV